MNVVPIKQTKGPHRRQADGPAHDLAAEQAVISAVLIDERRLECIAGWLLPRHFFGRNFARMFQAMLALREAGKPVDSITVVNWSRASGHEADVGGVLGVSAMLDATPAIGNIEAHGRLVFELWQVRELASRCEAVVARARSQQIGDARDLIDGARKSVEEVASQSVATAEGASLGETLKEVTTAALASANGTSARRGVPTGFQAIDDATGGLRGSEMWIVAARPSCGKTILASCIAVNVTAPTEQTTEPLGVLYISAEQTKGQLATRMVASEARVPVAIHHAMGNASSLERLHDAYAFLSSLPLWLVGIDDALTGITCYDVKALARTHHRAFRAAGVKMVAVVVDHMHRLRHTGQWTDDRAEEKELGLIAREMKSLAAELDITTIVLAQMNRSIESRGGAPRMSDLKGSGAIEAEADVIVSLVDAEARGDTVVPLYFTKNREGEKGLIVPLLMQPQFTRFDSCEPGTPVPFAEPTQRGGRRSPYEARRQP